MDLTPAEICIPAIAAGLGLVTVVIRAMVSNLEKSYNLPQREAELDAKRNALAAPRSPMQMYLDGGGDLSNPRVAALLAEADRGFHRNQRRGAEDEPQDAERAAGDYDSIGNDAALLCSGIVVAPDAYITVPSGETITGAEFHRRARVASSED